MIIEQRCALMELEAFLKQSKNKEKSRINEYKKRQKNIGEAIEKQQKYR